MWGAMTVVGFHLKGWYGMVPCGGGADKSVLPVDGDRMLLYVLLRRV